jgi:MFS family permease
MESQPADTLSRSETVFMVAALVLSVVSFMLNATMLSPAIRDINGHLGPNAFAPISSYFYLAGAIANVVLIRWSDYIGRKRVLLGILIMLSIGTLLCVFGTSLPVVVAGRVLQGASNITFGLTYLIMRERLTAAVFGVCCGVISAVNGGVGGTDALLAGYLVDHFGYRSIFVLTLVVGVVALALGWKALPADNPLARPRAGWTGWGLR